MARGCIEILQLKYFLTIATKLNLFPDCLEETVLRIWLLFVRLLFEDGQENKANKRVIQAKELATVNRGDIREF